MTRWLRLLAFALLSACSGADDEASRQPSRLVIYSTADTAVFQPVIEAFRRREPQIAVSYIELEAGPLYQRHLHEVAGGRPRADLLLSSAMDLQVKLVNDGHAAAHVSSNAAKLPAWARWRDEAFGITFEPAVMVYNRTLMAGRNAPASRPQLVETIKASPGFWQGRIGTYDIARSSVGYLLAAQDARQSSDFGALLETFGAAGVQTNSSTGALLDDIEAGKLVLGYNLLGSYARARIEAGAPLTIVYPQDYTLAVSRTAVIPRTAPHPGAAHAFLEYLLSLEGQRMLAAETRLSAARPEVVGPYSRLGIADRQVGPLRPIPLGPGLLAYLDQQKRQRLLETWRRAVDSKMTAKQR